MRGHAPELADDSLGDAEDGLSVDDVGIDVRRGRHGEPGHGEQVDGAVVVGVAAWRWSRRRVDIDEPPPEQLDPELEQLVDDELRRLEA